MAFLSYLHASHALHNDEFRTDFGLILIENGENPLHFLVTTKSGACAEVP